MSEEVRNDIVRLRGQGASVRSIARRIHVSRRQILKVLAEVEAGREGRARPRGLPPKPRSRLKSLLDSFEGKMREILARFPEITAVRMQEELAKEGFTGKYTIVKARLREIRPPRSLLPVVRFETGPGQQAQMDYSPYDLDFSEGGRRRVHAFSYVLAYSRRQYLHFVEAQDFETTVREHIRAFEYLGGPARVCLYDNMKVVVDRHDEEEPIYNARFLAFATHYGFRPWACRIRRSQTKGKVERPFWYVETNLLNGRSFRSLEHLNEVAAWWLANVADVRTHRETKRRPIDLHEEELPCLLPMPKVPFDTAEVVYRTVDPEGNVAWRQNAYSVPWRLIGKVLPVRITETEVIVYGPDVNEVARHALIPRSVSGRRSIQREHLPSRRDPAVCLDVIRTRFEEIGAAGPPFLAGLLKFHRCARAEAMKILACLRTYRREDVLKALERALRYHAFSASSVDRILAVQADPKPPSDLLKDEAEAHIQHLIDGAQIVPRPTSEYEQAGTDASEEGEDGKDEDGCGSGVPA